MRSIVLLKELAPGQTDELKKHLERWMETKRSRHLRGTGPSAWAFFNTDILHEPWRFFAFNFRGRADPKFGWGGKDTPRIWSKAPRLCWTGLDCQGIKDLNLSPGGGINGGSRIW